MLDSMAKLLEKPSLYTKSEAAFWDDEHISEQMLKAHLDPEFEGASRKKAFIEKSALWIGEAVPPSSYPLLLDIGCGPGIYAERFAEMGYQVSGIDFSKRSIEYARNSAIKQGFDISYHYQDYLAMNLKQRFDFATMIYCDYGALSTEDRQIIMQKAFDHLKPGGRFLLDVFSMAKYNSFKESQTWEVCHDGGFWRAGKYAALKGCYKYPDHVTLEQISIISDWEPAVYYLWNTYFTKEMLIQEAAAAGFKVGGVFGDVAGCPYNEDSHTIAMLLEK
ncbi:MAG: methyltransferase domain-containing protein [Clostridiales bacterium]